MSFRGNASQRVIFRSTKLVLSTSFTLYTDQALHNFYLITCLIKQKCLSNSSFLKAENVACKAVWGCLTVKSFAILRLTVNLLPLWLTEKLLRLTVLTVNPPSWVRNSVTGLYDRGRLILTVRTKYAFCGCLKLLILIDAPFSDGVSVISNKLVLHRSRVCTYCYRSHWMLQWRRSPGVEHWCYHFPPSKATHGFVHDYRGRGGWCDLALIFRFCWRWTGEHGLTGHMWTERRLLWKRKINLTFSVGKRKNIVNISNKNTTKKE